MKDTTGVQNYIKAEAEIFFPEDHVCCKLCPLLETYSRRQCRRTGEYLYDAQVIGYYCPLKFEEVENEGI